MRTRISDACVATWDDGADAAESADDGDTTGQRADAGDDRGAEDPVERPRHVGGLDPHEHRLVDPGQVQARVGEPQLPLLLGRLDDVPHEPAVAQAVEPVGDAFATGVDAVLPEPVTLEQPNPQEFAPEPPEAPETGDQGTTDEPSDAETTAGAGG